MEKLNSQITTTNQRTAKKSIHDQPKELIAKYMRPLPQIKMNLKYKPMDQITKAKNYIVHIPKCFDDSLNFNWSDKDYLLKQQDSAALKEANDKI